MNIVVLILCDENGLTPSSDISYLYNWSNAFIENLRHLTLSKSHKVLVVVLYLASFHGYFTLSAPLQPVVVNM